MAALGGMAATGGFPHQGRGVTSPAILEPGAVVADKYEIGEELGRGGMGTVVAATHLELDKPVALKLLDPSLLHDERLVRRFSREARAAAKLDSAHVARVLDVGSLDLGGSDLPYIVMERLKGRDLRSVLDAEGSLPVPRAVDHILEACAGLAEAHRHGIVHRDVKPSNLFVAQRADGSELVKVLDFGISKAVDHGAPMSQRSLTRPSDVFGSPRYMSPEHLRSARAVDLRSDIWALGVVLYELVSGKTPFAGASVAELHVAVLEREPTPITDHLAEVDATLVRVLKRCLAKVPERRYEHVLALATELAPLGTTVAARALEQIQRAAPNDVSRITAITFDDEDDEIEPSPPSSGRPLATASRNDSVAVVTAARPAASARQVTTTSWDTDRPEVPIVRSRTPIAIAVAVVVLGGGWAAYRSLQQSDVAASATSRPPAPVVATARAPIAATSKTPTPPTRLPDPGARVTTPSASTTSSAKPGRRPIAPPVRRPWRPPSPSPPRATPPPAPPAPRPPTRSPYVDRQ